MKLIAHGEDQLDFFRTLQEVTGKNFTNTFEFWSALPAILFNAGHADTSRPFKKEFTYGDHTYLLTMKPANVMRKGETIRAAFPGQREEIIREVVTKLATDDPSVLRGVETSNGRAREAELICTFSRIRRLLEESGHGWKLAEIREGLEVLSGCRIEIKRDGVRISPEFGLLAYAYAIADGDETGDRSVAKIRFHPLFIQALRNNEYRQIHFGRLMALKHPMARWLYQRISHHYTGVKKGMFDLSSDEPYNVTLTFLLQNTTMSRYPNLRDNVREVRKALAQMFDEGLLTRVRGDGPQSKTEREQRKHHGYDEELRYDTGPRARGRRPIVDALWKLWLSADFIDDIIQANTTAKKLRTLKS